MTREEAKKYINCVKEIVKNDFDEYEDEVVKSCFVYKLIDKIYDDFESKICRGCKYFLKTKKGLLCNNPVNYDFIITDEKFGCNRFERKIIE